MYLWFDEKGGSWSNSENIQEADQIQGGGGWGGLIWTKGIAHISQSLKDGPLYNCMCIFMK